MIAVLTLSLLIAVSVSAYTAEEPQGSAFVGFTVLDYRGGDDWNERVPLALVEIDVYVNGVFAETVTTCRRGQAGFTTRFTVGDEPVIEFRISQSEGFLFDDELVRAELRVEGVKGGTAAVYLADVYTWMLHPVNPDIPLGTTGIQWIDGLIYVYDATGTGPHPAHTGPHPTHNAIIGAEINIYVDGTLHRSVLISNAGDAHVEMPFPIGDEPNIELRLVQANGFQFDSVRVPVVLAPPIRVVENVLEFRHRWGLYPIESNISDLNLATASTWAREGISEAVALGIVPESLQNHYTSNITRAEFTAIAVLLYETITGNEIQGRITFNDTNDINVQKAAYIGIITGTGNNNFSPNMQFSREQAAVIITRLAEAIGQPLPIFTATFADNADISSWARAQTGQVQSAGIMEGVSGNRFNPQGTFTREQSIITMLRLFDYLR